MRLRRREFFQLVAGAAALPGFVETARAQAYPTRPLTFVVFVPAGGTPDIIARLVGQALSEQLGQSIIIDNRPGAGGNLALQAVARAPADGYTLLQVASPHAVNVTLYQKVNVTVTRDIVPIASTNRDSFVLMVSPSFRINSVSELIAYARSNPGKVNLASTGTGNLTHLCGELLRMMTAIDVVHVPYRGTPAAQSALMAGDVQAAFDAVGSSVPIIQAGAVRAIGVSATAPLQVLPEVRPIAEAVPGYTVTGWLGFGAPRETPPEIIERLNREINTALANPAVKTRMAELGSDIFTSSPAEFGQLIADDTEKWASVVKHAGLKAD
jgi:tripartite-type tricarboxylate transporter receptor subunit TctC